MAIQITGWRPDTCDCVIQYSWDDSLPIENRVHNVHLIERKCAFHATLDGKPHFDAVQAENVLKNAVLGHVVEGYPSLVDSNPDGTKELKPVHEYVWSFDATRKLQAEFTGVDKVTAQLIQASINLDLGVDKVEVKIP